MRNRSPTYDGLESIASPPPCDASAHSPKADLAGSGPLVRFGKPALAAGIVALLLGRDVHAMQTKAGIERAVAGFLEEAPKTPAIADRGNQGLKAARVHAAIGSAKPWGSRSGALDQSLS